MGESSPNNSPRQGTVNNPNYIRLKFLGKLKKRLPKSPCFIKKTSNDPDESTVCPKRLVHVSTLAPYTNVFSALSRLSAFVNKVFCQASAYIKDDIDNKLICSTFEFLESKQVADGSFAEALHVYHREMRV